MKRITTHLIIFAAGLALLSPQEAEAEILSFSFTDPVGDHTGLVDVLNVVVTFDNTTADYDILLTAHAANPFNGSFRINLNLFNPDTGTTAEYPSFFQDFANDFNLTIPTTTMKLMGTNSCLLAWEVGDRVATTSIPFGSPEGVISFRSSVANLPRTANSDIIVEGGFATIIPEPATLLLLGLGAMMLRKSFS
jgi:hypothetical protein